MDDNYYLLLELDFDPAVEDQAVIDQRIEEKRKFWSKNSTDFKKGTEYKKCLELLPDIKITMSIPSERNKHAEAAKEQVCDKLKEDFKVICRNGEITEDIIEKIIKDRKLSVDTVNDILTKKGIKIKQKQIQHEEYYNKYYKNKPKNADVYENVSVYLKTFNMDNFYDFLNPGTIQNVNKLPCEKLKQLAQEKKKTNFVKNDNYSSSGKKVCEACGDAFKDENSKAIYDQYLIWRKTRSILDHAREILKLTDGNLSYEQGDFFIGNLTELFKDRTLAENILNAFCKVEKIAYSPNLSGANNTNIKVCGRCGYFNDVSDGRKVCEKCGNKFVIKCPKCSTESDANIKACKNCGFKFQDLDTALALCDLARHAIKTLDFEVAKVHLEDAEKHWPGSSEVKAVRQELDESKRRIGDVAKDMRNAVRERRYYEAKKQYEAIKKIYPNFKETDLESEIRIAIETAQSYYDKAKAQSTSSERDIIENCIKAQESCRDFPGVKELILKFPPQIPTNLNISTDGHIKTNILSWSESASEGIEYYSIVRKRGAIPINNEDGDLVGRVNICSVIDSKILPAVSYFYAVFAERAGVYSKPLISRTPVVNLFEIDNVKIATGESFLQLEWDLIPSGSTVELFRITDGGKEDHISSSNSTSYLDSNLKNDIVYNYRLCLAYFVNGQKLMTEGITSSGIPTKLPNAIESLMVESVNENTFQATWENPDNSEVHIYHSTNRPEFKFGDRVSKIILDSKMSRLALTKTASNSGTFQLKGDGLQYIIAVIIKSGTAVIGVITHVTKGGTIKIKNVAVVNDKINIFLDLPKAATGFVVLYRFDKYPVRISDRDAIRKYISAKQFLDDNALIVSDLKSKNFYFSVFAEFNQDGEKDYSTATNYLFVNTPKEVITYAVSIEKKFFGFGEINVKIDFSATNESFILPDIDIVSSVGNTPMFKNSAKLFHSIPTQPVTRSLQVKIPIPKNIERDTFIRAFFKNEASQSSYQLQLKINSNPKIS